MASSVACVGYTVPVQSAPPNSSTIGRRSEPNRQARPRPAFGLMINLALCFGIGPLISSFNLANRKDQEALFGIPEQGNLPGLRPRHPGCIGGDQGIQLLGRGESL